MIYYRGVITHNKYVTAVVSSVTLLLNGESAMNPFTTLPKLFAAYNDVKKFNSLKPEIEKLRSEGKYDEEAALINKGQKAFVESFARKLKVTFEVIGEENIPEHGPFMIYSNHQSYADVPAILWMMKDHGHIAFVAKDEWRKYKPVGDAIEATRSIFLVRGNSRDAVKSLSEVKEITSQGFNMAVFPEGTRSRKHEAGEFKAGAFKFAEKAKVPILPVTLDGGYHLIEETGSYQPCHIKITVHPLVHIEEMDKHQQKEAAETIESTILSAL